MGESCTLLIDTDGHGPMTAVLVPKLNLWRPVMLPDDYLRKMKQDLAEMEALVDSMTRYEPDRDAPQPSDDPSADLTRVRACLRLAASIAHGCSDRRSK